MLTTKRLTSGLPFVRRRNGQRVYRVPSPAARKSPGGRFEPEVLGIFFFFVYFAVMFPLDAAMLIGGMISQVNEPLLQCGQIDLDGAKAEILRIEIAEF